MVLNAHISSAQGLELFLQVARRYIFFNSRDLRFEFEACVPGLYAAKQVPGLSQPEASND